MFATKVPPLTARVGLACHSCFTERSTDKALARCSKCRSDYDEASNEPFSQRDWASHKALCKTLHKIEHDPVARASLLFNLPEGPSSDSDILNRICTVNAGNLIALINASLNRPMNVVEQNIVVYEPKCLACTRTDRILRIETGDPSAGLKSCSECHLAFFCSEAHWKAVSYKHISEPSTDGHDGLSQCALNNDILINARFDVIMNPNPQSGVFQWAPERVKDMWMPLPNEPAWDAEVGEHLRRMTKKHYGDARRGPPTKPFICASSEGLSFPMTILYALQNLNQGDDGWTKKDTLTIHILGASVEKEVMFGQTFEEILHCLPKVRTLKLLLCGPDLKSLPGGDLGREVAMEVCPLCRRRRRKRIHQHVASKYHDYVQNQKSKRPNGFTQPDLAIAFNSGCSQSEVESWKGTIKILVDERIPTVFTSYDREEAEGEAAILRNAGATLVPILGPRKNPWGSQVLRPEPNKVEGYFASNGWLCAGFGKGLGVKGST
ncbi:hypothetical protein GYMLUDRAFT_266004 [Collybiopsis luxurians FD-317 M1]|uniref:Mitochondrial splicing suppressor 51-like C-terminal domain-containing protein n=1 Tax=Collybiopsis luxurians FD-317 M1 TaxID=944289 RepID=A0A0D0AL75_9AGAR|nr:hypothetical protein GYMLUDRAFT_266004 [Collybiopsis luxurians FD-317 M1]